VLVGNVGSIQGGIAVLPDAEPDDGVADVIILKPLTFFDHVVLVWRLLRRIPDAGPQAEIARGTRVDITCDRSLPIEYDGEFAGSAESLSVSVMPRAITMCCAEQS
jgi:diacylglycerol kinase family enzyme